MSSFRIIDTQGHVVFSTKMVPNNTPSHGIRMLMYSSSTNLLELVSHTLSMGSPSCVHGFHLFNLRGLTKTCFLCSLGYDRGSSQRYCSLCCYFLQYFQGIQRKGVPYGWWIIRREFWPHVMCSYNLTTPQIDQGRYIPLFASAVYDNNALLKQQGLEPVNLKSVMIGASFLFIASPTQPLTSPGLQATALLTCMECFSHTTTCNVDLPFAIPLSSLLVTA